MLRRTIRKEERNWRNWNKEVMMSRVQQQEEQLRNEITGTLDHCVCRTRIHYVYEAVPSRTRG